MGVKNEDEMSSIPLVKDFMVVFQKKYLDYLLKEK